MILPARLEVDPRRGTGIASPVAGDKSAFTPLRRWRRSIAMDRSSEVTEQIAVASEEQARSTDRVSDTMHAILGIATDSAVGADQTAPTVQGLAEFSKGLNAAVGRFKMNGHL
jgi:hypothetical protein